MAGFGAVPISLLRGVHVLGLLSLFGTLLFAAAVPHGRQHAALLRLAAGSAVAALLLGLVWFVAESAALAQPDSVAALLGWLPAVALRTQFGNWLGLRLLLLACVLPLLWLRRCGAAPVAALVLAAAAVAIQPALGHAGATPGLLGSLLIGAEALHLLAAGGWLGGLTPLWLVVRRLQPAEAAAATRRFSAIALLCVGTIALSGSGLGIALVGSVPALLGTAYGRLVLLKVGLFALALLLAVANRFVLTRRLANGDAMARRALMIAVRAETAIAIGIVLAAGMLAEAKPGIDAHPALVPPALLWLAPAAALAAIAGFVVLAAANMLPRRRAACHSGHMAFRKGWR